MRELAALCRGVIESPQEMDRLGVLADLLEDHGDPRAGLVRLLALWR